jgi:hypothetical protein
LAEATALVERVELSLPAWKDHVIVGFRANGCGSVYLGADEAYQFNTSGELRRAYRDGVLYKAERGRLVSLTRRRTPDEVQLLRNELDAAAQGQFLERMSIRLAALRQAIGEPNVRVVGQVPAGVDVISRVAVWLGSVPRAAIARAPHAR